MCATLAVKAASEPQAEGIVMQAMVLHRTGDPLRFEDLPDPNPRAGEIRLRISACGVC